MGLAASSTRAAGSTGRGSLPPELRQPIIKMACIQAQGDPGESGSCAKLASTELNLVSREFETIASPMQWYHLELNNTKDVGIFVVDLLPKYARTWRKVTLSWSTKHEQDHVRSSTTLYGSKRADIVLTAFYPNVASPPPWRPRAFLFAIFHHAMLFSTAVDSLTMYDMEWMSISPEVERVLPFRNQIRELRIHYYPCPRNNQELSAFLHSIRHTLEELHIGIPEGVSFNDPGDVFVAWQHDPSPQPALPRLRLLSAPEPFASAALLHERNISDVLQHVKVISVDNDWNVDKCLMMLHRHAAKVRTFTLIKHNWSWWSWRDVRNHLNHGLLAYIMDACTRHDILFRLALPRARQGASDLEGGQCPADLAEWVELI